MEVEALGCCALRREGFADSERASTKSLTMKSLLLKVSIVNTGVLRVVETVGVREAVSALGCVRKDIVRFCYRGVRSILIRGNRLAVIPLANRKACPVKQCFFPLSTKSPRLVLSVGSPFLPNPVSALSISPR